MDRVKVSVEQGVASVTLNRPDKLNALDLPMFRALVRAGEAIAARPDVRAVVLSGEGPSFCAGLDFAAVMAGGPKAMSELIDHRVGPANLVQRVAWIWRELPMPVIAAVHGHCYGGGLQIALGADIRIAHPESKIAILEIAWGIVPDMGITATLLPWMRRDLLRELTYSGRTLSGTQAAEAGLVTRCSQHPVQEAMELAHQIAARNPDAVRAAKQLLDRAATMDVAQAFELETELQRGLLGSPNQMEAAMARLQKRTPRFVDPEPQDSV